MICERCGKEHDGSFGSGRFCSNVCAYTRIRSAEQKAKFVDSLKKTFAKIEEEGRVCETCESIFHSKDFSRKQCFNCLPTTVR